jgi:hypothetical protein
MAHPRALAIGIVQAEIRKQRDRFSTFARSANHYRAQADKDDLEAAGVEQVIAELETALHAISDPNTYDADDGVEASLPAPVDDVDPGEYFDTWS